MVKDNYCSTDMAGETPVGFSFDDEEHKNDNEQKLEVSAPVTNEKSAESEAQSPEMESKIIELKEKAAEKAEEILGQFEEVKSKLEELRNGNQSEFLEELAEKVGSIESKFSTFSNESGTRFLLEKIIESSAREIIKNLNGTLARIEKFESLPEDQREDVKQKARMARIVSGPLENSRIITAPDWKQVHGRYAEWGLHAKIKLDEEKRNTNKEDNA